MGDAVERRIGNYVLVRPIGRGGMGQVFLARQENLDREVAVKILPSERARDETYLGRFHREAKAAAALAHPNVVAVIDSGEDPATGDHYIVLEYVEGRDLDEMIMSEGPIAERRALEIARDVARALVCAAAAGIVHRDVKPGNIMIAPDGVAKLTDLGLAKVSGSQRDLTAAGVTVGSPWYMAPEQAIGRRELDVRADLYSLGLCLWEALTAAVPYVSDDEIDTISPFEVLRRHAEEPLADVRAVVPSISAATAAIVARLAARDPDDRHASADEALAALERALADLPAAAPAEASEATPEATPAAAEEASSAAAEEAPSASEGPAPVDPVYALVGALGLLLVVGGVALTLRGPDSQPLAQRDPSPQAAASPVGGAPDSSGAPGSGAADAGGPADSGEAFVPPTPPPARPPDAPAPAAAPPAAEDAPARPQPASLPAAAKPAASPEPAGELPATSAATRLDPAIAEVTPDDAVAPEVHVSAVPTPAELSALLLRDVPQATPLLAAAAARWRDPEPQALLALLRQAAAALAPGLDWPPRERALETLGAALREANRRPPADPALAVEVAAWAAFTRGALSLVRSLADPRARAGALERLAAVGRGVDHDARIFLARVDAIDHRLRWARVPVARADLAAGVRATASRLERSAVGHVLGPERRAVSEALAHLLDDPEACLTAALAASRRAAPDTVFLSRRLRDVPAGAAHRDIPAWGLVVELEGRLSPAASVEVALGAEITVVLRADAIGVDDVALPLDWRGARTAVIERRPWGLLVRVPGASPEDHLVAFRPERDAARAVFTVRTHQGASLRRVAFSDVPAR